MPDPAELIAVARDLVRSDGRSTPTDAHLRRAVSTAYYALFHKIVRAAAARFMGVGQQATPGYLVLYRSFDHRHMRETCEKLGVDTLKDRYKRVFGRSTLSQEARDFATAFPPLQEARHLADYDPRTRFEFPDVISLVDAAEIAMAAFDAIAPPEQADILALLMAPTRG